MWRNAFFRAWIPVSTGATINFAENSETVAQDLVELSPTYMFAVPRVLEKFYSRITTAMAEATWIGRRVFAAAMRVGMRRAEVLIAGEQPNDFIEYAVSVSGSNCIPKYKEGTRARPDQRPGFGRGPHIQRLCSNGFWRWEFRWMRLTVKLRQE